MNSVAIVGAGMAGLSAAISLAARGHQVTVFEAASRTGGKVGFATFDGVKFDTGPSLLTLPHLIDEVFALAGTRLEDELELICHDHAFRYLWPDATSLDVHFAPEDTRESIGKTLGAQAAREFDDFLAYARRIWEAAAPNFVLGPAPSIGSALELGLGSLTEMMAIDPLSTMVRGIDRRVATPELRDLFLRYATYNGSNPFAAPATLNCIAWVELGLGGWGIEGGMYELVRALERVARDLGVEIRLDTRVTGIEAEGGAVTAVRCAGEAAPAEPFDAVVVNADLAHLLDDLLPGGIDHGLAHAKTPSMSGWTAMIRARRRPSHGRPPHTVLFPKHYEQEFSDIFDRDQAPREPTVYLCAQEKAHCLGECSREATRRAGWTDHEPLFVMANAPAEPAIGARAPEVWAKLRERVLGRLHQMTLIDLDDVIVWERTPSGLASQFRGTRGSIYGAASNSKFAAFRRAPNRVEGVPGLYLASGSVHPGGGVPLCVQSGKTAALAVDDDFS